MDRIKTERAMKHSHLSSEKQNPSLNQDITVIGQSLRKERFSLQKSIDQHIDSAKSRKVSMQQPSNGTSLQQTEFLGGNGGETIISTIKDGQTFGNAFPGLKGSPQNLEPVIQGHDETNTQDLSGIHDTSREHFKAHDSLMTAVKIQDTSSMQITLADSSIIQNSRQKNSILNHRAGSNILERNDNTEATNRLSQGSIPAGFQNLASKLQSSPGGTVHHTSIFSDTRDILKHKSRNHMLNELATADKARKAVVSKHGTKIQGFTSLPKIEVNKMSHEKQTAQLFEKRSSSQMASQFETVHKVASQSWTQNKKQIEQQISKSYAVLPRDSYGMKDLGPIEYFGQGSRTNLKKINESLSPKEARAFDGYLTSSKNLKQTLLGKSQMNLYATQNDYNRLQQGRKVSKKFLKDNKIQLESYLSNALKSEQIPGAEVFDEDNMLKKEDKIDEIDESSNLTTPMELTKESSQDEVPLGRYDFNPNQTSKKNRATMAILQQKAQGKGKLSKTGQINNLTMESWINDTLQDAEHLDIPGVIVSAEHKMPINRYGVDRGSLLANGIPNEYIDRLYRSLFVYSVGFFELIKKMISHSERKHSFISRIWKVYGVLLEYCCQTDYKMMIAQINSNHDDQTTQLKEHYEVQMEKLYANEKQLKENVQRLQKMNEELERDKQNEQNLRLRLQEEFHQNTKNHEEEVQLRLKFESKLNLMHMQQRELDINYARAMDETSERDLHIKQLVSELERLKQNKIEANDELRTQRESLLKLEEQKLIWEQDTKNIRAQMSEMEKKIKKWHDEVNTVRNLNGQLTTENGKFRVRCELIESNNKALEVRNESLEQFFEQAQKERGSFENKSKELQSNLNTEMIKRQQFEKSTEVIREDAGRKNRLLETQRLKIEDLNKLVEDLGIIKETQAIELQTVQTQIKSIRKDFDDAAENLHKANRYRHELELRYKAEKLTQERLADSLAKKDEECENLQGRVVTLNATVQNRERALSKAQNEIKDVRDELNQKISQFQEHIQELEGISAKAHQEKADWAIKYEVQQTQMSTQSNEMLSIEEKMKIVEAERDQASIKMRSLLNTLEKERAEREDFEKENEKMIQSLKQNEMDLKITLEVSKRIEEQRRIEVSNASGEFDKLQEEKEMMERRYEMALQDAAGELMRLDQYAFRKIELAFNKFEQKQHELDRAEMFGEDLRVSLVDTAESNQKYLQKTIKLQTQLNMVTRQLKAAQAQQNSKESLTQDAADVSKGIEEFRETVRTDQPTQEALVPGNQSASPMLMVELGDSVEVGIQVNLMNHPRLPDRLLNGSSAMDQIIQTSDKSASVMLSGKEKITTHRTATNLDRPVKDLGEMRKNAYQHHDTQSDASKEHIRSISSEKPKQGGETERTPHLNKSTSNRKKKYICKNCGHVLSTASGNNQDIMHTSNVPTLQYRTQNISNRDSKIISPSQQEIDFIQDMSGRMNIQRENSGPKSKVMSSRSPTSQKFSPHLKINRQEIHNEMNRSLGDLKKNKANKEQVIVLKNANSKGKRSTERTHQDGNLSKNLQITGLNSNSMQSKDQSVRELSNSEKKIQEHVNMFKRQQSDGRPVDSIHDASNENQISGRQRKKMNHEASDGSMLRQIDAMSQDDPFDKLISKVPQKKSVPLKTIPGQQQAETPESQINLNSMQSTSGLPKPMFNGRDVARRTQQKFDPAEIPDPLRQVQQQISQEKYVPPKAQPRIKGLLRGAHSRN